MIIKNTPVPTADAGRKALQPANAQKNDHFASELKKQMSSGNQPQPGKVEQPARETTALKKEPAEDKVHHAGDDEVATLPPVQSDPLALLTDSSQPPDQTISIDPLLLADGQIPQPVTQQALISNLQALTPAATVIVAQPQTQAAQGDITQAAQSDITQAVQGDITQALAMTTNDPLTLPAQPGAVSPATPTQQASQASAIPTAPDSHAAKSENIPVSGGEAQVQAGPEISKEVSAKPASFGETMANAMQHMQSAESQPVQNMAHSTPIVAASVATATPAMPAIPVASVTTGTLQPEVGTPAWQQSLGQQIAVFSRNGVHHAELRLHPEELGALQVSLKVNNDQAQVHFVAESHQVRAALESAMPHLRTMLAESGIQLGQSSVGADTASSSGSAFSGEFSGQNNRGQERSEPGVLAEDERILQPVVIKYSSGINTFV